jgi:hypothetical protein
MHRHYAPHVLCMSTLVTVHAITLHHSSHEADMRYGKAQMGLEMSCHVPYLSIGLHFTKESAESGKPERIHHTEQLRHVVKFPNLHASFLQATFSLSL